MFTERSNDLTRRQLLGGAAATAGVVVLAACGGSSQPAKTTKPTRGGTFRMGMSDSSSSDSLEVANTYNTYTNEAIGRALYDGLTAFDPKTFAVVNWLAEEMEPANDASYWTMRVRDAQFHNGKTVTADDVIFTLRRNFDPQLASIGAILLASIDLSRLKKMDNKTVRVYLKYPDVSIPEGLAYPPCSIVPVGYNAKNPVGTGPFRLASFHPGVRSEFTRNHNYWQSGKPYLDALALVGFADPGPTRMNALNSGEIDGADRITFSLVPSVQSGANVLVSKAGSYISWEMRTDIPPFDDMRVRQAMKLIANRPQIVNHAFGGTKYSAVANDLGAYTGDPLYDHTLPQRQQDLEQAKSLLKQAGHQGLTVQLAVSDVTAGVLETAQVLAQNASGAGMTIKVNNIPDAATYFTKYYKQAPFKFDYFSTQPFFPWIAQALTPGSPYWLTNWRDPEFQSLVTKARSEPDLAKRKTLAGDAQKIVYERGPQGIFAFNGTTDAHRKTFAGFYTDVAGDGLNGLQFQGVYST